MYISFWKLINEVIFLSDNISRKYISNVCEWFIDIIFYYVYVIKFVCISVFKIVFLILVKLFFFFDWINL